MAAQTFEEFGCDVQTESPNTPDRRTPNVTFRLRGFEDVDKVMPDGNEVEFWTFRNSNGNGMLPGPLMRVRQNQIVHTSFEAAAGSHTIHHHGIEPTTFNDGVGHTSFETPGNYTYQWMPAYAGTYFYHCHVNTALHFEMGMYGLLIVDPASGQKRLYDSVAGDSNSTDTTYDVEAFMAVDDVDPEWRGFNADAGLCGDDEGQNNFRPRWFMINGVVHPTTLTAAGVAINMRRNQRLLLRLVNASYSVVRTTIAGLSAQIVGVDGRRMCTNAAQGDFAQPISVAAGAPIMTASAVRYDLLIQPTTTGTFTVRHEFLHWITGARDTRAGGTGIAETRINVTA